MAGQIIIVNGTSGSGKTTACELFAKRSDGFWLTYGIDHFLGGTFPRKFGHGGDRCQDGFYAHPVDDSNPDGPLRWTISDQGFKAFGAFHQWIAAASRQGCNIILDHLMMIDPPLLQDCIWRLNDLPVLFVTLKPPFDVLMDRVANRQIGGRFANAANESEQMRKARDRLDRLRPWFYDSVYANDCYDLEIDTDKNDPEQVCDLIERRLADGPGKAFEELRGRFPR